MIWSFSYCGRAAQKEGYPREVVLNNVVEGRPEPFSSRNVLSNILGMGLSHRYCRLHD